MDKKKKGNPLGQFVVGVIMLALGLYWFSSKVMVTTGFYGLHISGFRIGSGLVIVPFIVGVIWLFLNTDSFGAKLLTVVGLVLIIASIIMNTHFYFRNTTLYEYLLMIVFIVGGGALVGKVLLADRRDKKDK